MSRRDATLKRALDIALALVIVVLLGWLILLAVIAAGIDTRQSGLFRQRRVGRDGKLFTVYKIRTMRTVSGVDTDVTTSRDPRTTSLGRLLRRLKIDELPQVINVLIGDMSFVGPRPDVPGFADQLVGDDRIVLSIRPGITGPATLKYRDEEELLAGVDDPEAYNRDVIFPDKVSINRRYIEEYRLADDLRYLLATVIGR